MVFNQSIYSVSQSVGCCPKAITRMVLLGLPFIVFLRDERKSAMMMSRICNVRTVVTPFISF